MDFSFEQRFEAPGSAALYTESAGCGFVTDENYLAQAPLRVPELNSGFVPVWWRADAPLSRVLCGERGAAAEPARPLPEEERSGRTLPLWYKLRVPGEGVYQVQVTMRAMGTGEVLLFVSRRRLAFRGTLPAGGALTVDVPVDVSPIIPGGQTQAAADDSIDIALVGQAALVCVQVRQTAPGEARRVFILGDSTVTDQTASVPYAPGASYAGWGQMLPWFLPRGLCVSNHAHSGLTSETFEEEGHWGIVEKRLRPGDICLMQFGHNDQKRPHLTAGGGYTQRLRGFVRRVRAAGAQPVLITPLARNGWGADGQYHDLLGAYAAAVQALGREEDVPVLNLHAVSCEALKSEGLRDAKRWFYPGDFTHTNDYGAYRVAAYIGKALCAALSLEAPAREPWTPVPAAPLAPPPDCTLTPPDGSAGAYAEYDEERPGDTLTRIEALTLAVAAFKFFPVNGYQSPFADVVGQDAAAVTVQTAVQSGIIPKAWTKDGNLHPSNPVTLGEFLSVLLPGYACRSRLTRDTEYELAGGADRAAPLTRAKAAAICRKIRF